MPESAGLPDPAPSRPVGSSRRGLITALGVAGVAATTAGIVEALPFGPNRADTVLVEHPAAAGDSPAPSGGDDTAALQDWLDHGGSRLAFTAGTYRVSRGLTIPAGVSVSGFGARLRAEGGAFQMVTIGGDDVTLVGLEIDGNAAQGTAGVDPGLAGVLVPAAARATIRGCHLHDMPAIGVSVNGGSTGYLIAENTIAACGRQAISIDHSDDGRVTGNHIDTALHGVQWWGGDSAKSSDIGIRGLVIADNRIANVMGGIWGSLGQHIAVTGNRVENCSDVGVDFEGCQDCVATGNAVHDAAHACYSVFYASQRIVFSGNVGLNDAAGSIGSGFMAYRQPPNQHIEVSDNQLQTAGAPPVNTEDGALAWSTVRGNTLLAGQGSAGMQLRGCDEIRITDNEVVVAAPTAIAVEGGSACQIEGNHLLTTADASTVGSASGGVHLLWRSAALPCQRNRVRNNVVRGFRQSVHDDCGANPATYSLIENNVATSVVHGGGAAYTGVIANNRDETTHAVVVPTAV